MDFKDKLMEEFLDLIKIPSPSLDEREVADYIKARLEGLGLEVYEDQVAEKIGGNTGNIIGILPAPGKKKIMFNSHMDVVSPCQGVKPIIEGDLIRSDGSTTLGADNKAGIAAILNMVDYIVKNQLDHPELYLVFTVGEELGSYGAGNIELEKYGIDYGFILDGFVDPGIVAYGEPELNIFQAKILGRTGHLFFDAESGRNAFKALADAMSQVDVGVIDEETIVNCVYGGEEWSLGAIPGQASVEYIIASFNDQTMAREIDNFKKSFREAGEKHGLEVEVDHLGQVPKFVLDQDSAYLKLVEEAADSIGLGFEKVRPVFITDAGNINRAGVKSCILGTGVRDAHTTGEWARISHIVENGKFLIEIAKRLAQL